MYPTFCKMIAIKIPNTTSFAETTVSLIATVKI